MSRSHSHAYLAFQKGMRVGGSTFSAGMTLIEVLIAILLFAVFTASFLVVTEMIGSLIPAGSAPLDNESCNGPGLEASCINVAFDVIVPALELAPEKQVGCFPRPGSIPGVSGLSGLSWPEAYEVCIYSYPNLAEDGGSSVPGLYLLQAQALASDSAFWRLPVQRVFCRPYHHCVKL